MIYKVEKYILNFFFGKVFDEPISFNFVFNGLRDIDNKNAKVCFRLKNSIEIFPIEKQFLDFNSVNAKQEVGHNPRAAAHTGDIEANYPSFKIEDTYLYNETINMFLQNFVSYLLTFFQRRRVIIGILNFTCDKVVHSLPPFFAGELVDSIGYGEPLVPYDKTSVYLNKAVGIYAGLSSIEKEKIESLLVRYNETLNLPYTYEKSESYWRIIESLSDGILDIDGQNEYDRVKVLLGIKKQSDNLKKFIKTLIHYKIKYNDQEVIDSFIFRNNSTHEYLNIKKINSTFIPFIFLNKCVEKVITSLLKIDEKDYLEPSYTIIQNRVL